MLSMKLFALTSVLFMTFILGGCTISQQSGKMTDEQIFEKKQECGSYQLEMISDANKYYENNQTTQLQEIFFSPSKNTCYYTISLKLVDGTNILSLFDFFSKERISSAGYEGTNSQDFEKKIQQLKQ